MKNFFLIQIDFKKQARDFLSSVVFKNIDINQLAYMENKPFGGVKTFGAHITICYGFDNEIQVSDSIDLSYEEIESLDYFNLPGQEAKVLVAFPKLHNEFYSKLHEKYVPQISKDVEIGPYKPHITLAYLKKDAIIDLDAIMSEVSGKKLEFDNIVCVD